MENLRKANLQDIKQIHKILKHFAGKGDLLGRPLLALYEKVREFYVYEIDNVVIGCIALAVVWENMAEIRSLAIDEKYQKMKIGTKLIKACLKEAEDLSIKEVFTLTYQPDFFKKQEFNIIDKSKLPHKIWADCINCPHFPDCNEIALIRKI